MISNSFKYVLSLYPYSLLLASYTSRSTGVNPSSVYLPIVCAKLSKLGISSPPSTINPWVLSLPSQFTVLVVLSFILFCLWFITGSNIVSAKSVTLSTTIACSISLLYKTNPYISCPVGGVISILVPSLRISHSVGSIALPVWSTIENMSLSDLFTFATNPAGGVNLILPANGESSIVLPTCQLPVVQNKYCFAPNNQSLALAISESKTDKS